VFELYTEVKMEATSRFCGRVGFLLRIDLSHLYTDRKHGRRRRKGGVG
jgi:hypothetical protein